MKEIEPKLDRKTMERRELEQELITAAQHGSSGAFEELYRLYVHALYRISYSITKNREDAEDALQDTYLRAYLGLKGFRREAQFYSWIVRITINSSLLLLRRQRTRRELPMEGAQGDDGSTVTFDCMDARPGPEQIYDYTETHVSLVRSIKSLPSHLRVVAELRLLRERSVDETRKALGISEAAIKSRLYRVRTRLAAMQNAGSQEA